MNEYRWEYSPLANLGNWFWARAIDPILSRFAHQDLDFYRRIRGVIQVTVLVALVLIPASLFYNPSRLLTASGLLFDIAGALRVFLLEELTEALEGFTENRSGNLPSVAMRELIMPEAVGPNDAQSPHMSFFYYKKRGVLFIFIGFVLQMIGDLFG